jgi:hypothetical protein
MIKELFGYFLSFESCIIESVHLIDLGDDLGREVDLVLLIDIQSFESSGVHYLLVISSTEHPLHLTKQRTNYSKINILLKMCD